MNNSEIKTDGWPTNDERLARFKERLNEHKEPLIMEYEWRGEFRFTSGMTATDCILRTDKKCNSSAWRFESLNTQSDFFAKTQQNIGGKK